MNSLISRTTIQKVWDKFKKGNGNYKPRIIPSLKRGGNIITLPHEIAETERGKKEDIPYNKERIENSHKRIQYLEEIQYIPVAKKD